MSAPEVGGLLADDNPADAELGEGIGGRIQLAVKEPAPTRVLSGDSR
jgi:hypothetical protein